VARIAVISAGTGESSATRGPSRVASRNGR